MCPALEIWHMELNLNGLCQPLALLEEGHLAMDSSG